jgi:hypothetical protein
LASIHTVRIPSPKSLLAIALVGALGLIATFIESPPRSLPADERIPERMVFRRHPKLGGGEMFALTNRQEILKVMTAMPGTYGEAYCACFGFYDLEFHSPTGIYRSVNYKPGDYLRDSQHPTGQSSVPRRFGRIVGGMITRHEVRDKERANDSVQRTGASR